MHAVMKTLIFAALLLVSTTAYANETYVELLRSDIRTQKVAIITEVMDFTDTQREAFWPVYREYEVELSKVGDARLALIKDYAKNFDEMTDVKAGKLIKSWFKLQEERTALKKKWFKKT